MAKTRKPKPSAPAVEEMTPEEVRAALAGYAKLKRSKAIDDSINDLKAQHYIRSWGPWAALGGAALMVGSAFIPDLSNAAFAIGMAVKYAGMALGTVGVFKTAGDGYVINRQATTTRLLMEAEAEARYLPLVELDDEEEG